MTASNWVSQRASVHNLVGRTEVLRNIRRLVSAVVAIALLLEGAVERRLCRLNQCNRPAPGAWTVPRLCLGCWAAGPETGSKPVPSAPDHATNRGPGKLLTEPATGTLPVPDYQPEACRSIHLSVSRLPD